MSEQKFEKGNVIEYEGAGVFVVDHEDSMGQPIDSVGDCYDPERCTLLAPQSVTDHEDGTRTKVFVCPEDGQVVKVHGVEAEVSSIGIVECRDAVGTMHPVRNNPHHKYGGHDGAAWRPAVVIYDVPRPTPEPPRYTREELEEAEIELCEGDPDADLHASALCHFIDDKRTARRSGEEGEE